MSSGYCNRRLRTYSVYAVYAKDHKREQKNVAMTVNVESVYELLDIVVGLKASGYRKVDTIPCGKKFVNETGKEVVRPGE